MSGSGGSSIIAAYAVVGEMGPKPPHDGSKQAQLDREELQELEHELYADPGAPDETEQKSEPPPAGHHLHLPHLPGYGA
jgi:hypothetical protein